MLVIGLSLILIILNILLMIMRRKLNAKGLKFKLLRKIRKKWSIIKLNDPTLDNRLVYRGLINGKCVEYAYGEDKHNLLLSIAYSEIYGRDSFFNIGIVPFERVKHFRRKRLKIKAERKRNLLIKKISKTEILWP